MLDEDVNKDAELSELDEDERPPRDYTALKRTIGDTARVVTFASFVVVFVAAVIGNWQRSQNVDPEYAYDIALRTIRFGGTYYENGIHNKGPLEIFVYQAASWISSHNSFWYAISLFIAIGALIIGWAAARTAQAYGGNRDLGIAAAAVVFIHFAMGPSDYAGVMYARNMTTPLLSLAWILILWDRAWSDRRRALIAAIVTGAILGIAVQTLVSTAFAAIPISLLALALVRIRRPRTEYLRVDIAFVGAGALAFLSAPIWYLLRGKFDEFFSGWWSYARFMNIGTGRSLGSQFALGWDQFYAYYQKRPLAAVVILAFVAMVAVDWSRASRRQRLLGLALIGWFAGAWIELVLAQRYSSHYFSVTSTPTAMMAAALAGRVYQSIATPRRALATFVWPMIALVLAIYLTGPKLFVQDMKDLSKFTSVNAHAVELDKGQSGDLRSAVGRARSRVQGLGSVARLDERSVAVSRLSPGLGDAVHLEVVHDRRDLLGRDELEVRAAQDVGVVPEGSRAVQAGRVPAQQRRRDHGNAVRAIRRREFQDRVSRQPDPGRIPQRRRRADPDA